MKYIVVIKERWVLIGTFVEEKDNKLFLTEASVIRYWGTERGLGQIAISGPTDKTTLDFYGDVDINVNSILYKIRCKK